MNTGVFGVALTNPVMLNLINPLLPHAGDYCAIDNLELGSNHWHSPLLLCHIMLFAMSILLLLVSDYYLGPTLYISQVTISF